MILLTTMHDETLGAYDDVTAMRNPQIKDSFSFEGNIKETKCYHGKISIVC